MIIPKKSIAHLVSWFIIGTIVLYFLDNVLYFYGVIGSGFVLVVYYTAFFNKKYVFPALAGIILAFLLTYYFL